MNYPGVNGFLGTRASLALDVVVVAMAVFLPLLGSSIYAVRYRRLYGLHKRMQVALAGVLAIVVAVFEFDMRVNGWELRAQASPYFAAEGPSLVFASLYVHLCFAVTTALLWIGVTAAALRQFPDPPMPGAHSRRHIFWARLAALDMVGTAVSGWIFYWLAFVAR